MKPTGDKYQQHSKHQKANGTPVLMPWGWSEAWRALHLVVSICGIIWHFGLFFHRLQGEPVVLVIFNLQEERDKTWNYGSNVWSITCNLIISLHKQTKTKLTIRLNADLRRSIDAVSDLETERISGSQVSNSYSENNFLQFFCSVCKQDDSNSWVTLNRPGKW